MATLAGTVVLRALSDNGERLDQGVVTVVPSEPASPESPSTPEAPVSRVESPVQKRTFAAGEQVTVTRGIGFLSSETGALETWAPINSDAYPWLSYTPDGALLSYQPPGDGAGAARYLIERSSGNAYRLAPGIRPIEGSGHGTSLVVAIRRDANEDAALLNVATGVASALGLSAPVDTGIDALASPDGLHVAVRAGTAIALLDLGVRTESRLAEYPAGTAVSLVLLPGAIGFTVEVEGAARRWFAWDGAEVDRQLAPGYLAPNGKYLASYSSPGPIKAFGGGGLPSVGLVRVAERAGGKGVMELAGANLTQWQPWSAGSDTFVVEVHEGYRVVSLSGETVVALDDAIHVLEPRPSPAFNGLFGTNRGTVVNTARGTTVAPRYAEPPWHATWNLKPGELVVQLATPGKGRGWPYQLLPAVRRSQPLANPFTVEVSAGGDCLNLRQIPAATAAPVTCMPDGSKAAITAADDPEYDPKTAKEPVKKYAGLLAPDGTTWLHLTTGSGAQGWADSRYLAWAKTP